MAAVVEERRGPRDPHPNRVPEAVEERILDLYLEKPTYGSQRIPNEIRLLERHPPEFRMRLVETSAPGELLNQHTFYWGVSAGA